MRFFLSVVYRFYFDQEKQNHSTDVTIGIMADEKEWFFMFFDTFTLRSKEEDVALE